MDSEYQTLNKTSKSIFDIHCKWTSFICPSLRYFSNFTYYITDVSYCFSPSVTRIRYVYVINNTITIRNHKVPGDAACKDDPGSCEKVWTEEPPTWDRTILPVHPQTTRAENGKTSDGKRDERPETQRKWRVILMLHKPLFTVKHLFRLRYKNSFL